MPVVAHGVLSDASAEASEARQLDDAAEMLYNRCSVALDTIAWLVTDAADAADDATALVDLALLGIAAGRAP